jgi:hypothetical protein
VTPMSARPRFFQVGLGVQESSEEMAELSERKMSMLGRPV